MNMGETFRKNFLTMGLCLSLVGCAHAPDLIEKPYVDPHYGMTKKDLTDLLGKPEKIEIYKKSNDTLIEFDFYVRKYLTSEEKVPIGLINNKVVGWGKTFYEDHVSDDDTRIK